MKFSFLYTFGLVSLLLLISCQKSGTVILFDEDFSSLQRGPLATDVGAHTEYHYIAEARPQTPWAVSTFRYNLPASWEIRENDGRCMLMQTATNPDKHWHPMVVRGSEFWHNYTLETTFKPSETTRRNGIVFRYLNDRCYYFAGIENDSMKIILVNDGKAFREPNEKVLYVIPKPNELDSTTHLQINVEDNNITLLAEKGKLIQIIDSTFTHGKIGLLSDSPTRFYTVKATALKADFILSQNAKLSMQASEDSLMAANPKMIVYKKISLGDFGVGRNLRFGDLNGDGEIDVLVGQVINHGPKDRNSELSCLTAKTLDGKTLWQTGTPDPWKTELTSDVAFQIHDINNDGQNEVIYCINQEMIIANGATGKIIRKAPTPVTPGGKALPTGHNIFSHILGDCLYFCDLQGKGWDSDIIIKDRYNYLWAYDSNLKLLWKNECRTGHYPYAFDTDGDGKDELAMGYTLFDHDGKKRWSLDEKLSDHADGVAIVHYKENEAPVFMCAASDEGMFFANLEGQILKHHFIGHVQNPVVANFRNDMPGLETVSVNFWGNQGIIHMFDSDGNIYKSFEPNQYGSMCLPLNWNGSSEELFVLNANATEGGAWDGFGRKTLAFPDDGHPDMCYAVLDITGDCRDEIVVWNPTELWVYTQSDNPQAGKLYKPVRNSSYNYSNYQATVSLSCWNE